MSREALAGFHQVTVQQVLQIDTEIFVKLADQTREGLEVCVDGTYRLDSSLQNLMVDPQISMLAMPRQKQEGYNQGYKRPYSETGGESYHSPKGKAKAKVKVKVKDPKDPISLRRKVTNLRGTMFRCRRHSAMQKGEWSQSTMVNAFVFHTTLADAAYL